MLITKDGNLFRAGTMQAACLQGGECGRYFRAAGLTLDRYEHAVSLPPRVANEEFRDAETTELSRAEFRLLEVLMRNAPKAVAEDVLIFTVFKIDWKLKTNRLAVLVNQLRRRVGWELIETVRGFGYRLHPAIPPTPATD